MSKLNANAEPFVVTPAPARTGAAGLSADAPPFAAAAVTGAEHYYYYGAVHQNCRSKDESEERCLFMTFSNGSPLTKEEISHHLSRWFGDGVERVYVQKRGKIDPKFGKLTFTTPILPEMIMADSNVVKMMVNNKPIWLKKYVPRSQRKSLGF